MLCFILIYNLTLGKVLKLYIDNIDCVFSQGSDIQILYYARRNYVLLSLKGHILILQGPHPDIRFVPDQLEFHWW